MPFLEPDPTPPGPMHRGRRAVTIARSTLPPPIISRPDRLWRLEEDYALEDRARVTTLRIPAGFLFDLASVPRILWRLVAPFELSIVAPLGHDFLYQRGGRVADSTEPRRDYTRAEADALFRDVMALEGVEPWRRRIGYRAVRIFGGSSWRGGP